MSAFATSTATEVADEILFKALSEVEGLGCRRLKLMLEEAGSVQALWQADASFLARHLTPAKKQAFEQRRAMGLAALQESFLAFYDRLGIRVLAYSHPDYPPLLKEIHDPPMLLYVKGDVSVLSGRTLGVVGTRRMSEYGRQVTEKLVGDLQESQATIISGLAAGVDTAAHWAALNHGLPTVAVFGCGLDIIFPASNRRLADEIVGAGGALVSEYPLGTPGNKYTYPKRNRIVAGLSQGVLVVEGDVKSGALITARLALEEGRSVYAVPGNIFSPGSAGPHYLIQSGAMAVTVGQHMVQDLNWLGHPPANQLQLGLAGTETESLASLSESERRLLNTIPYDPVSIETIQTESGLPAAQVNEGLTVLELEGLIVLLPGAKACRK